MKRLFYIVICLVQFYPAEINARVLKCTAAQADSPGGQRNTDGIKFVDINGVIKKSGNYFVLLDDNHKSFRVNCASCNLLQYLGKKVKVRGVLVQGYDNPKYGEQNLPLDKIDPKDIIEVITGVTIEFLPTK